MAIRTIVGITALIGASVCGIIATLLNFEMIDKVNERLPEDRRLAWLGWYPFKYQRLKQKYKRLYPDGRLRLRVRIATAVMFACLLICAWGFGLFVK
jgi:hypothetical protein